MNKVLKVKQNLEDKKSEKPKKEFTKFKILLEKVTSAEIGCGNQNPFSKHGRSIS